MLVVYMITKGHGRFSDGPVGYFMGERCNVGSIFGFGPSDCVWIVPGGLNETP